MCDATDFATPESAASAATTIKIYGKLRAAAGVNFVSSGTGSLTNDITHVGASATGIYSIGLAKADLSDASAAWYDQYIITLSCTGCARQTLVVDGGIDASALSSYQSRFSNIESYLVALSAIISDAHSAAILGASNASDAYSAALLGQSLASDAHSAAAQANSRVLLTQSLASDAHSAAAQANSRVLLLQSSVSDVQSFLVVLSGAVSDAHSAAILGASHASDAYSAAAQANSRVLLTQSLASDAYSAALLAQSLASDAHSAAAQANSRVHLHTSTLSDVQSQITAFSSDFQSRVPKAVATDSQVESLFNAAIPDSVPADGTVPSVRQALYMINQYLYERSVSGTTMTVKKADGSTTLLTLTINDASSPTSVTRAT